MDGGDCGRQDAEDRGSRRVLSSVDRSALDWLCDRRAEQEEEKRQEHGGLHWGIEAGSLVTTVACGRDAID